MLLEERGFSYSYTPENDDKLIEAAHQELVEHFRLKPVDATKEVAAVLDIVSQRARRLPPVNPATYQDKGEAL